MHSNALRVRAAVSMIVFLPAGFFQGCAQHGNRVKFPVNVTDKNASHATPIGVSEQWWRRDHLRKTVHKT